MDFLGYRKVNTVLNKLASFSHETRDVEDDLMKGHYNVKM